MEHQDQSSDAASAPGAEELRQQLEAAQEQAEQHLAAWQRAQADYQNLKKRSQNEVQERVFHTTSALLLELLPVVDDFERALEAGAQPDSASWLEGLHMIQRKLYQFLERTGVQPIATEGQPFDPNFHEAVGQSPGPAGQIITQVEKGYLIGQRVLRPARVIVGSDDSVQPTEDKPTDDSGADPADGTADGTTAGSAPSTGK